MTTEIEKTRRALYDCLDRIRRAGKHRVLTAEFEERLEEHFEELRKARIEFTEKSDREIQSLHNRLAAMTEERDQIQQRLHAIDHAYNEQSVLAGAQAREIERLNELNRIAGQELIRVQAIARQHLDDCRSAEKHSDRFSEQLRDAQAVIANQEQLIAGQRLAIAELYMGISKPRRRTLAQIKVDMAKNHCETCDGLGYVDCNGGRPTARCPEGCQ